MSAGEPAQRVFISYRREDSAAYAGRIYDAMVARFGESNVFMDVEMAPGVDFVKQITEVVSGCAALIVVIGPNWATVEGENGGLRLHEETDFVRQEVTTACQRPDVVVIPALVNNARMPRSDALPEGMEPLARRNALELSDGRWRYDVGRLTDALADLFADLTGSPRQVQPQPRPPTPVAAPTPVAEPLERPAPQPKPHALEFPQAARLVLEGIVVAGVAGYLGRTLGDVVPDPKTSDLAEVVNTVGTRTVTWALVGIALAVWLAIRTERTDVIRCALLGLLVGAIGGALSGVIFGVAVKLPDPNLRGGAREHWETLAIAAAGALIGALIGTLWRRPRLIAGLLAGLLTGLLFQELLNKLDWNARSMPGLANSFAARAGAITGATLVVLILLDHRREARRRSSSVARPPSGR